VSATPSTCALTGVVTDLQNLSGLLSPAFAGVTIPGHFCNRLSPAASFSVTRPLASINSHPHAGATIAGRFLQSTNYPTQTPSCVGRPRTNHRETNKNLPHLDDLQQCCTRIEHALNPSQTSACCGHVIRKIDGLSASEWAVRAAPRTRFLQGTSGLEQGRPGFTQSGGRIRITLDNSQCPGHRDRSKEPHSTFQCHR